jgi:hypothetical protein
MLDRRTIQDIVLRGYLPTTKEELRAFEERLLTCGDVDQHFLEYSRPGMHIFGQAPEDHACYPGCVPIDYIPCDHHIYIIRYTPINASPAGPIAELCVHGREACSLCGKPLRLAFNIPLDTKDLVLVGCPALKEGMTIVDVLPIFSRTLVQGSLGSTLDIPYQRSKNSMTRVDGKI